jgi:hypothetical protein
MTSHYYNTQTENQQQSAVQQTWRFPHTPIPFNGFGGAANNRPTNAVNPSSVNQASANRKRTSSQDSPNDDTEVFGYSSKYYESSPMKRRRGLSDATGAVVNAQGLSSYGQKAPLFRSP